MIFETKAEIRHGFTIAPATRFGSRRSALKSVH
jgi:hypothetical protein